MFELLKSADQDLFLFLNGKNNSFFDFVMYWASNRFVWIPFYALLLFFLIKAFGKKSYLILLLIAAMITVSDQVSSGLVKKTVQRLRPCHNPEIAHRVHLVKGVCGGSFGYFSSHASNTCALSLFLILIFKKKMKSQEWHKAGISGFKILALFSSVIVYAVLVSYSRIYLGTHYPFDVLTGIVFGSMLSIIFARIFFRVQGNKI